MSEHGQGNGWVKLHRKLLDNPIARRPLYCHLWVHLLLRASHKETFFIWNGQRRTLRPGQILTSRSQLSRDSNISASTVEKILTYLEAEQQIEQHMTNKFRVITVKNWVSYQSGNHDVTQCDSSVTAENGQKGPNTPQSVTATNSKKNPQKPRLRPHRRESKSCNVTQCDSNEDSNEDSSVTHTRMYKKKFFCPNSDEFRLARLLFDLIRQRKPDYKEPNLQKWAATVDRMIRLDHRKVDRIEAVIRWCQADTTPKGTRNFCWANNILSTEKLREQFDQLELRMGQHQVPVEVTPVVKDADGYTPKQRAEMSVRGRAGKQEVIHAS